MAIYNDTSVLLLHLILAKSDLTLIRDLMNERTFLNTLDKSECFLLPSKVSLNSSTVPPSLNHMNHNDYHKFSLRLELDGQHPIVPSSNRHDLVHFFMSRIAPVRIQITENQIHIRCALRIKGKDFASSQKESGAKIYQTDLPEQSDLNLTAMKNSYKTTEWLLRYLFNSGFMKMTLYSPVRNDYSAAEMILRNCVDLSKKTEGFMGRSFNGLDRWDKNLGWREKKTVCKLLQNCIASAETCYGQSPPLFVAVKKIGSNEEWRLSMTSGIMVRKTQIFVPDPVTRLNRYEQYIIQGSQSDIGCLKGKKILSHAITAAKVNVLTFILMHDRKDHGVLRENLVQAAELKSFSNDYNINNFLVDIGYLASRNNVDEMELLFNVAVWSERIGVVHMLLNCGYDVNSRDFLGNTALHCTAMERYTYMYSPLDEWNDSTKAKIAKLILKKGGDVNVENARGETALGMAIHQNYPKLVEVLLSYKFDPQRKYQIQVQCIYFKLLTKLFEIDELGLVALDFQRYDLQSFVPRRGEMKFYNLLDRAIILGYKCFCIKKILNWGFPVNSRNEEGLSPLHLAVLKLELEKVQILLTYGANINIKDENGATPLSFAYRLLQVDIFRLLLDNGAEPNISSEISCKYCIFFEEGLTNVTNQNKVQRVKREMYDILLQHCAKLRVAGLLKNKNILEVPPELVGVDFQENCGTELAAMSDKIGDLQITFYDVLSRTPAQIVGYWRNESFRSVIEKDTWKKSFPSFGSMLISKLELSKERRNLLLKTEPFLRDVLMCLPYTCAEKLITFFSDQDLRRLIHLSNNLNEFDC